MSIIQGPTVLSEWQEIELTSPRMSTIYSKDVDPANDGNGGNGADVRGEHDQSPKSEQEREFQAAILRYAQMLNTTAEEIGLAPSQVDRQVQELAANQTQANQAKDTTSMTRPVVTNKPTPLSTDDTNNLEEKKDDNKWLETPEGQAKLKELVDKMNELPDGARQAFLMKVPANIRAALLQKEKEEKTLTEVRRSVSFDLSEEPAPRFDPTTFSPERRHWLGGDGQTQQPLGPSPENDPDRNHKLYDEPWVVAYDRELNQAGRDADAKTHADPLYAAFVDDLRSNDW